jgi:DNA-binding GntR family transcriptional regulator
MQYAILAQCMLAVMEVKSDVQAGLDDVGGLVQLSSLLSAVSPRVLREQVRDALRDAILSTALPPGTRVGEAETAAALSVSRTPVREAIRELVQEGLLNFTPHRGAVVVTITDDEIESSYRVKSVLEEEAMARAAVRLTTADFATLERLVAEMAHLAMTDQFVAANEAEWRFHSTIADAAALGLVRRTWTSIDDLGRLTTRQLYARHGSFPVYLANLAERHRAVIEVLRERNPERAAAMGRSHLDEMHQLFLADIEAASNAQR